MKRLMSALLAALLVVCMLPSGLIHAEDKDQGSCGKNVLWEYDADLKVLTISGSGAMEDYSPTKEAPWNAYYEELEMVDVQPGVTRIGAYAFSGYKSLNEVNLPKTLLSIGSSAFEYCEALESIQIPKKVNKIDTYAFSKSGLTEINLPASVTEIGYCAFSMCPALKTIIVAAENQMYSSANGALFDKAGETLIQGPGTAEEFEVPGGTVTVGEESFSYVEDLKRVILPDTVKTIGSCAFTGCTSLKEFVWSQQLETIESRAFDECTALVVSTLPQNLKTIGYGAFKHCLAIQNITIPKSVTELEGNAFYDCQNLVSADIKGEIKTLGEYAFGWCMGLEEVILPDTLKTIEQGAFYGCEKLESLKLPASLKTLGDSAFGECASIEKVVIPAGVKEIPSLCFISCTSLKEITIPASVRTIYEDTFSFDTALTDVYFMGTEEEWAQVKKDEKPVIWDDGILEEDEEEDRTAASIIGEYKQSPYLLRDPEDEEEIELDELNVHFCYASSLKAANASKGVKLSWKKNENTAKYTLYRKAGSGSWKKIATVKAGVTTYTDKKATKQGTKYAYKIEAVRGTARSEKSKAVVIYRLKTPKLTSAKKKASGKMTVKWKSQKKVTGYQIKYVTGSKKKTVTVKGAAKAAKTISKLKNGKTYKVSIRAYKKVSGKKYYSEWSSVKKVKM